MWTVEGYPLILPPSARFVVYTNEDLGYTANMVPGTNDNFQFVLPMPASLNLFTQVITVHSIEFFQAVQLGFNTTTSGHAWAIYLAMLDRDFGVSWFGNLADADDEAMKATFAGPIYVGVRGMNITATASVEGSYREADSNINAQYWPPTPLRLTHPLFITLVNQSTSIALATNVVSEQTNSVQERFVIRAFFTVSNLTASEMAQQNVALRYQRLES